MPSDYWEDVSDDYGFDWDEVESIDVIRGDGEWDIVIHTEDESYHIDSGIDDSEMTDLFWDDLYDWAMDEGIDVDRDIDYGEAA